MGVFQDVPQATTTLLKAYDLIWIRKYSGCDFNLAFVAVSQAVQSNTTTSPASMAWTIICASAVADDNADDDDDWVGGRGAKRPVN